MNPVFIVGAGPGDPGLLTVRAAQVLARAEVLVYDALVSQEVLALAPCACQRVFAGKRRGRHAMTQEQINALLVRESEAGKCVVRLKGGDPFVFGRGGEEALALRRAGIAFEIVPGISSALAAAAYAGIPLTHRGVSASFTVAAGHTACGLNPGAQVDWEHAARTNGTLVLLMAVGDLPALVRRLIALGKSRKTPAAIVESGTLSTQRTIAGTLGSIADDARRAQISSPAIVIVGEVVALRHALHWFEQAAQVRSAS